MKSVFLLVHFGDCSGGHSSLNAGDY
jgi:hypothetical protein